MTCDDDSALGVRMPPSRKKWRCLAQANSTATRHRIEDRPATSERACTPTSGHLVSRNDPPRIIEKEDDALDQRHVVEGIYVSKGKELARRMQLSLISRSGTTMELLGMFDLIPPNARSDKSLSSSVVVLWKFPPGPSQMNSLPVDEMGFILLEGQMNWNFKDGKPVRLGTEKNDQRYFG